MDTSSNPQSRCSLHALNTEEIKKELLSIDPECKLNLDKPNRIYREFKFKNFSQALEFVNKVGIVAEELNHHPDITLKWGYVKVEYWTHTANGLTQIDFIAVKAVNEQL